MGIFGSCLYGPCGACRMRSCDYRLRKKGIRLNCDDDDVRSIYVMFDLQNYTNIGSYLTRGDEPLFLPTSRIQRNGLTRWYFMPHIICI